MHGHLGGDVAGWQRLCGVSINAVALLFLGPVLSPVFQNIGTTLNET